MPRIVVTAAISTGIKRLTPESTMAWYVDLPESDSMPIWSISTIAFLINMPDRLSIPSRAMKPNGCRVTSRPSVTPITASGTQSQMIAVLRSELNSPITMKTMIPRIGGKLLASAAFALAESSAWPPQAM